MSENPIFSYTKRDYEGSRKEGISRIPILSSGNWTDLNATDPGVIILDYLHALVDMVQYYQDHQALESFLSTAKERSNIFRLAKQLSYEIRSAKGALCDVTFSSELIYDHPIKIPKYTRVSTADGITYLTSEDAYISAGEDNVVVHCTQGKLYETTYTYSEALGDAITAQSIHLTASNIDTKSIEIRDSLGRLWEPVDLLIFSTAEDRVYQVDLNPDDSVTIKFGNGERGVYPKESDILTVKYIISDASEGRIGANTIVTLEDDIYDNGNYVEFLVSNSRASTGGYEVQSSREIRELAPGAIKAQGRAVTLSDFERLAKLIPGVSEAKAYDVNNKPSLLYHEVQVLIVPENYDESLTALQSDVYNYLYQRMIPPTNLQILVPSRIPIDLSITVKKLGNELDDRIIYDIREVVIEYFENRKGTIGEDFYPTDLATIISRVSGVRYIVSITPNSPVEIADSSVAILGEVSIYVES